jgi:hypothetical protein
VKKQREQQKKSSAKRLNALAEKDAKAEPWKRIDPSRER